MNWGNYIKRTAVRRVVWIVVGLVVYAALSFVGVARAQSFTTAEQAHAACVAAGSSGSQSQPFTRCAHDQSSRRFSVCRFQPAFGRESCNGFGTFTYQELCPVDGGVWDEELKQCLGACEGLSPRQGNFNTSIEPVGASYCVAGCGYEASDPLCTSVTDGPNPGYWCNVLYNPTGQECTGTDDIPTDSNAPKECPANQVQLPNGTCAPQGTCPVGQAEINGQCHPIGRCPTGFVKSPDGSCSPMPCPSGKARGQDGTCKADDNNDGVPDEDEPGTGDGQNTEGDQFSGGDSCAVPPTCSGDAIMCGQARIQWRIDCNTRRERFVQGGDHCDVFSTPICIGEDCDPVEHVQTVQAWKAACLLDQLVNQNGEGEGDGDWGHALGGVEDRLDGIASFLGGDGHCLASEEGCEETPVPWDDEEPTAQTWSSGLPSTGSCPAPINTTISLAGYSTAIQFSYQPVCDFAALMHWVLIAAATIMSGFLVAGVRTA